MYWCKPSRFQIVTSEFILEYAAYLMELYEHLGSFNWKLLN